MAKTSKKKSAPAPGWKVVNRIALAALMGCHPETITAYVRQGMPVQAVGKRGQESRYDTVECLQWWRDTQAQLSAKELAQTKGYEVLAELNALKLRRQQGELLERDVVVAEGQSYTKAWSAKVRALPRTLELAGLIRREDAAAAASICRDVLIEISAWKVVGDLAIENDVDG